jgi:prolyl oligopeptidase
MDPLIASTGFKGDLSQFSQFLRTDPQFFYENSEDLLRGYRDICKRIDPELMRLFGQLPRLPYGVARVPEYSEKAQTTAYYEPGTFVGGRPGLFYANTYDLKMRPKWEMEALTLHESVPGHHLQISLAQELDLPEFRRHGTFTAFIEGWGLYAESLGDELGLYRDPYSKYGQLTYEMWRAIRLVIDTGIHSMGWSRDDALKFFHDNSSKADHDIMVEVDRYIAWPGQALAYKLGQLKIRELRKRAEQKLGSRFDIRRFHDAVLGSGALPLDLLEKQMDEWLSRQQ